MKIAKDQLLEAMGTRFDYWSARAVFERVLAASSLEEKDDYSAAEVGRLSETLGAIESRVEALREQLSALAGGGGSPPAKRAEVVSAEVVSAGAKSAEAVPADVVKAEAEPVVVSADVVKAEAEPQGGGAPETKRADAAPAPAVTIKVDGIDVPDGGQVLVCGGAPALGDWKDDAAVPLTRDGDGWSVSLVLEPGVTIELKFVVRDGEGALTWEAGDNRSLAVGDDGRAILEATWHAD